MSDSDDDLKLAIFICLQWLRDTHSLDKNVATDEIRTVLSQRSWVNKTFEAQKIGLKRQLSEFSNLGIAVNYDWVLHEEAYYFMPEPTYQYLVHGALIGIWRTLPQEERVSEQFDLVAARQLHGWTLSFRRAEPKARVSHDSKIGWVQIPYIWDDFLQVALEGLLECLDFDPARPLSHLCTVASRLDLPNVDWSRAHPYWNGLIARTLTARLGVPHTHEAGEVDKLCSLAPSLNPYVQHQVGAKGQHLGNSLAYLAKAFTIAHETAHIIQTRKALKYPSPDDKEMEADLMALLALWNNNQVVESEVREGQDFDLLWKASGLLFFFSLQVFERLMKSTIIGDSSEPLTVRLAALQERSEARRQGWRSAVSEVHEIEYSENAPSETDPFADLSGLERVLQTYCDELSKYSASKAASAVQEANLVFRE